MSEGVISALLALVGTMMGTFGGILTSGKLTNYRLEQLEKKVDRHNNFALKIPLIEERIEAIKRKTEEIYERSRFYENYQGDNSENNFGYHGGA